MTNNYHFEVENYRLDSSLSNILSPEDSIFISSRGIYICRGVLDTFPANDIVDVLRALEGTSANDHKPFAIFGQTFDPQANNRADNLIALPQEMIHIDNHQWITHFRISKGSAQNAITRQEAPSVHHSIEHPHHIEMMSPESRDQFVDKIETVLKHIEIGNATKVVIARQLNVSADVPIDIRLLVCELMDSQPESYVFAVNGFVGASPELLVEKFSRSIRCLPMAGTRRRHARIDDDDADIADLQTNMKDRNEHQVVIDDIVSKLETVASNVTSSEVPHVVRLPHVAHLATSVTATAAPSSDLMTLITTLHPTPAVAGTPTQTAMKIIAEVEGFDRDMYGAPVGWVDSSGDGQSAIAIRCAQVKGAHARLYAGVGIVSGSDALQEWDETQAKFGVMRDAMMNITQ
ncbi:MAG TPA: isochorismate synthase [Acidimicrobiia bacterium]|nr:isochorismate synthase [Acidimicrobiia bacterium]